MKRLFCGALAAVLALALIATLPALAQFGNSGLTNPGAQRIGPRFGAVSDNAPALRFIATRGQQAYSPIGSTYSMNRTHHYARDTIAGIRLVYPGWWGDESALGSTAAITASIEYPADTFTRVLFSGSANGTVPNGGMLTSDMTAVVIPNGAKFWVRTWMNAAAGVLVSDGGDTANGDRLHYGGAEVTDQTMSGAIQSDHPGLMYFPIAILGMTTKPGVLLIGDSITYGTYDQTGDGTGDQGIIARSIGPAHAYSKISKPSETFTTFLSSTTNRVALGAYASHVVGNIGINDFLADRTSTQVETDLSTLRALYPSTAKFFWLTVPPYAESSDSWATLGNQSPFNGVAAREAHRVAFNTRLRAGYPAGLFGYFETADVFESSRNSGKWVTTGKTQDGFHPSYAGYQFMAASGAIVTTRITVPRRRRPTNPGVRRHRAPARLVRLSRPRIRSAVL